MERRREKRDVGALIALVIVVIVVVAVVLVVRPQRSYPMPIERTFSVTMSSNDVLVRPGDQPAGQRYTIDGELAPTLTLRHGRRYRFVLREDAHPLYLTTSPLGGPGVPGTLASNVDDRGLVHDGSLDVVVDRGADRGALYYQSTRVQGAGGRIVIV
jgi:hypothetical protein